MMKALNLLNQIIEHEQEQEKRRKIEKITQGKGEEAIGESWTTFHLRKLKELLENEKEE